MLCLYTSVFKMNIKYSDVWRGDWINIYVFIDQKLWMYLQSINIGAVLPIPAWVLRCIRIGKEMGGMEHHCYKHCLDLVYFNGLKEGINISRPQCMSKYWLLGREHLQCHTLVAVAAVSLVGIFKSEMEQTTVRRVLDLEDRFVCFVFYLFIFFILS